MKVITISLAQPRWRTTQTQRVCSFFLMVPQTVVHTLASAGCSTVSEDRTRHARHILISLLLWSIYQFSRGGNELIQTKQNAPPQIFEEEPDDKQFCWVGAKLTSVSFHFSHNELFNFIHSYFSIKTTATSGTFAIISIYCTIKDPVSFTVVSYKSVFLGVFSDVLLTPVFFSNAWWYTNEQ